MDERQATRSLYIIIAFFIAVPLLIVVGVGGHLTYAFFFLVGGFFAGLAGFMITFPVVWVIKRIAGWPAPDVTRMLALWQIAVGCVLLLVSTNAFLAPTSEQLLKMFTASPAEIVVIRIAHMCRFALPGLALILASWFALRSGAAAAVAEGPAKEAASPPSSPARDRQARE